MNPITHDRWFEAGHAFDDPTTRGITLAVGALLVLAPSAVFALSKSGRLQEKDRKELYRRCVTWAILAPLLIGPILLGAFWTILMVAVLSLWCYREFARATGLFRDRMVSGIVVVGIFLLTFAVLDHWYGFFVALMPLIICLILAGALIPDQPEGFLQRVALGILGYMLIGVGLGHLGYMANDAHFRPIILMIFVAVELNDVFAYLSGRLFGRRKFAPRTSPNKTVSGALGALVLTTGLVIGLGHFVFAGTPVAQPLHLTVLGILVSVAGQLGDLTVSSIKRDLGIKDMAATLPGHGGLMDRFDSLLLVAPAVFHYVGYFQGVGLDQPTRVLSGG